jgi:hypothetical protein
MCGTIPGFGCGKPVCSGPLFGPKLTDSQAKELAKMAFVTQALGAIRCLAEKKAFLTTDDVWAYLDEFNCSYVKERRIIGVAIRKAQKEGIIAPSWTYKSSTRRNVNHGRRIMIWRSLYWDFK